MRFPSADQLEMIRDRMDKSGTEMEWEAWLAVGHFLSDYKVFLQYEEGAPTEEELRAELRVSSTPGSPRVINLDGGWGLVVFSHEQARFWAAHVYDEDDNDLGPAWVEEMDYADAMHLGVAVKTARKLVWPNADPEKA